MIPRDYIILLGAWRVSISRNAVRSYSTLPSWSFFSTPELSTKFKSVDNGSIIVLSPMNSHHYAASGFPGLFVITGNLFSEWTACKHNGLRIAVASCLLIYFYAPQLLAARVASAWGRKYHMETGIRKSHERPNTHT
jgi:hypothetical protein